MASRSNVEIVRSVYEAFNRRDWDAAFRDQGPDVEVTTPPGPIAGPDPGRYRGREECQAFFEELIAPFSALATEPEQLVESGDRVVAVVKIRARPAGSDAEIVVRNGHLWVLHDGTLVSMEIFPEPEKALEAAGLRD